MDLPFWKKSPNDTITTLLNSNQFIQYFRFGLHILSLIVFLPILTVLLAAVGGVLFNEAMERHRHYTHTTKQALLWRGKKWANKNKLELEIQALEQEIADEKAKLEQKQLDLIKAEALSQQKENIPDFSDAFEAIKNQAIGEYQSGVEEGVSEVEQTQDEEWLYALETNEKFFLPTN